MAQRKIKRALTAQEEQSRFESLDLNQWSFTNEFDYQKFLEDFLYLSCVCMDSGNTLPESFTNNCRAIQGFYLFNQKTTA